MPSVIPSNKANINKEKTAEGPLVEDGDVSDHKGELNLDEEKKHAEEGGVNLHENGVVIGGGLHRGYIPKKSIDGSCGT